MKDAYLLFQYLGILSGRPARDFHSTADRAQRPISYAYDVWKAINIITCQYDLL